MRKLIVILGPTATGKSSLAVQLAKKFNGEVVSADSRQVYKGLDIGSAKITKKEMEGVPHHLLDVANPKRKFSAANYQKLVLKKIEEIFKREKTPILCGGTGFYIQAVVDGLVLPEVTPDWNLRKEMEKQETEILFQKLKKLDPQRARAIDPCNKRRIIRALEIILKTKEPVPNLKKNPFPYPLLIIGIEKDHKVIARNISKRIKERLKKGMIKEVRNLHQKGLSWRRLEELGLEYRFVSQFLQKKISKEEMISLIQKESEHFAKRQMTWFKKDKRIVWIGTKRGAKKLAKDFLK